MVVKTKRITKRKHKTLKGGGTHMPRIRTPKASQGIKKHKK